MQNDKLAETVAEQGLKYGDMLRELGTYFLRNPKRFRFAIELIHATEPIVLRKANKMWLEQSQWKYPKYKSLEAYVSFFAFGRFVKA